MGSLTTNPSDEYFIKLNEKIQQERENGSLIVFTKDWHPQNHCSFGKNKWPVHCVENTRGAELDYRINTNDNDKIILKGCDKNVDSYSAFFDNDHINQTCLHQYLQSKKVNEIELCGIALDYCVLYTCKDALQLGYNTTTCFELCMCINPNIDEVINSWPTN